MEIDLKKTPLSEIDLSKIDYEKSYVWRDDDKRMDYVVSIREAFGSFTKSQWKIQTSEWLYPFSNNGSHCNAPKKFTLHLFYKEVRDCPTCKHENVRYGTEPCIDCTIRYDKQVNQLTPNHWQPKESAKDEKTCENCKHSTKKNKQEPCCSCRFYSDWEANIKATPRNKDIIIEYEDLGDKVKIVKIEGVMTHDEIQKHANHSVYLEYFGGMHMFMSANKKELILVTKSIPVTTKYDIGCTISKMRFEALINFMKLSAKRLAELIKESKTVKRIEI
jgi:hypothetical protein